MKLCRGIVGKRLCSAEGERERGREGGREGQREGGREGEEWKGKHLSECCVYSRVLCDILVFNLKIQVS